MRPRLYLDVDGVLNACSLGDPEWGWSGPVERTKVSGWTITWSPEMVASINEATLGWDCHWLTTWLDDAPRLLAPAIGLRAEDWPVVGRDHRDGDLGGGWWKLTAIREHLRDHDGLVGWVDDDIAYDEPAGAWLAENPRVAPVCPRTGTGLTRRHWGLLVDALGAP